MTKLTNNQLDRIDELVQIYQDWVADGQNADASIGPLKDCKLQHTSMARGGDGGPTGHNSGSTIRGYYYRGQPNEFFQRICERMRWEW